MKENVKRILAYVLAIFVITMIISFIISFTAFVIRLYNMNLKTENINLKTEEIFEEKNNNIKKIHLDCDNANIHILKGDTFNIKSTNKKYDVKVEDGELKILEKGKMKLEIFAGVKINSKEKIEIYIPENRHFEKVYISAGVSKILVDNINADNLEIDAGVGNIDVKNGNINIFKLTCGVGNVLVRSKFNESAKIEGGVGKLNLEILNKKEDINMKIERGLGQIYYNGETLKEDVFGDGKVKFEIEGGLGQIDIKN